LADPERTRQVLINLLSNAVKFTPEGGAIGITAAHDAAEGMVLVTVSDSGIGIPADKLDKIFEKFEQVKEARKNEAGLKGTGLGLAIVRGIVEAQGGQIRVESEMSKGSRFIFSLPQAKG
jgi:signal transduction histidine kinase